MEYVAYLHNDRNSDFGVSFPDLPGRITAGKTPDEARILASEALAFHVEGMIEGCSRSFGECRRWWKGTPIYSGFRFSVEYRSLTRAAPHPYPRGLLPRR